MKRIDLIRLTLSNLRRQKLRTALTVTGVIVGTAAVTTMVSIGIGVKRSLIAPLEQAELLTSLTVQPVKLDLGSFSFSDLGRGGMQKLRERKSITDETIAEIAAIEHVRVVYPDKNVPLSLEVEGGKISVVGIDVIPDAAITEGMREAILAGGYWDQTGRGGAVLPSSRLEDLGVASPEEAVGRDAIFRSPGAFYETKPGAEVSENRRRVTVPIIGVYESQALGLAGTRVLLPPGVGDDAAELAGPIGKMTFGGPVKDGEYRALSVKVTDFEHLDEVRAAIDDKGYGTMTAGDLIGVIDTVFIGIEAALGLIGSVGLIVAFFGIANTMVMAVLERTREIGTLKALGARDRDVRRLFVMEAATIGFLGGLLGVGVSKLLGALGDLIANAFFARGENQTPLDLFQISTPLALGAVAFAVVTAVIAGAYPAWRASRLDPVVALRHE